MTGWRAGTEPCGGDDLDCSAQQPNDRGLPRCPWWGISCRGGRVVVIDLSCGSSGDGGSGGGGGAGGGEKEREKEKAFSVSLAPLWSVPVQVPAPECLAVLPERGLVSVSGRGTQAFSWK